MGNDRPPSPPGSPGVEVQHLVADTGARVIPLQDVKCPGHDADADPFFRRAAPDSIDIAAQHGVTVFSSPQPGYPASGVGDEEQILHAGDVGGAGPPAAVPAREGTVRFTAGWSTSGRRRPRPPPTVPDDAGQGPRGTSGNKG
jgi:hypothetical protein